LREDAFYGGTHTAIYGGSKRIAPSKTSLLSILGRSGTATAIDEDGMLLLHHACRDDSFPIPALRLIVEAFPGGMHIANNKGKTPPQLLSARASQRDADGMLLLHHQTYSPSLTPTFLHIIFKIKDRLSYYLHYSLFICSVCHYALNFIYRSKLHRYS